jgi:hypothetical protein
MSNLSIFGEPLLPADYLHDIFKDFPEYIQQSIVNDAIEYSNRDNVSSERAKFYLQEIIQLADDEFDLIKEYKKELNELPGHCPNRDFVDYPKTLYYSKESNLGHIYLMVLSTKNKNYRFEENSYTNSLEEQECEFKIGISRSLFSRISNYTPLSKLYFAIQVENPADVEKKLLDKLNSNEDFEKLKYKREHFFGNYRLVPNMIMDIINNK